MNNNLSLNILYKNALHFVILINPYCVHDNFMRLAFNRLVWGLGVWTIFCYTFRSLLDNYQHAEWMSRLNQIHALNRRLLRARFLPEPLLVVMGEDDWSSTPISKSAKLKSQNGTFIYIDVPISWLELLIKIDDQLIRSGTKFKTDIVSISISDDIIQYEIGAISPRHMDIAPPQLAANDTT